MEERSIAESERSAQKHKTQHKRHSIFLAITASDFNCIQMPWLTFYELNCPSVPLTAPLVAIIVKYFLNIGYNEISIDILILNSA